MTVAGKLAVTLASVAAWSSSVAAMAGDWPQFLGPARNGVSSETSLIDQLPPGGPKVAWRTPLGTSMSGIAVSQGLAVTLFQTETEQFVVALDAASGREKWKTSVAPVFENGMGNGPRSTPAINGDQIFAFTGEGILVALARDSGKTLWSVNVPRTLEGVPAEYGVACSPIVTDTSVIVQSGTTQAAVAAWDRKTGKLLWKSGSGNAGYSSPVLMTLADVTQLVVFDATGASGLDPAGGSTLWSFPFPTEYDCNTASPVRISENELLISAGENHGAVILQLKKTTDGLTAESVWSSLGKDSQLRAEWQTPVVLDGHLYGLDNSGSAGPITNLVCIRLADRKTVWQKARFGKSNLILADGRLWISTMKGELVVVQATPEKFQELGRSTVLETTRQAPALAEGFLFLRDDKEVVCLDLRQAAK
ncbi:MAG: PQQ-binding-like beta-propeller repeat protein [Planctomycetia bacterium]